jgi:hypothetical protein
MNRGADASTADGYGKAPLMRAAMDGHEDMVQFLLSRGNNINDIKTNVADPYSIGLQYMGEKRKSSYVSKSARPNLNQKRKIIVRLCQWLNKMDSGTWLRCFWEVALWLIRPTILVSRLCFWLKDGNKKQSPSF